MTTDHEAFRERMRRWDERAAELKARPRKPAPKKRRNPSPPATVKTIPLPPWHGALVERIQARLVVAESGCIESTGAKDPAYGYGRIAFQGASEVS